MFRISKLFNCFLSFWQESDGEDRDGSWKATSSVTNSTMVKGPQPKPNSVTTIAAPNYRDIRLNIGGITEWELRRSACLLDVLRKSSVQGKKFQLPGWRLKLKDRTATKLSPISGELNPCGSFTQALAESLSELQSGDGFFSPSKLVS